MEAKTFCSSCGKPLFSFKFKQCKSCSAKNNRHSLDQREINKRITNTSRVRSLREGSYFEKSKKLNKVGVRIKKKGYHKVGSLEIEQSDEGLKDLAMENFKATGQITLDSVNKISRIKEKLRGWA